jgi:epoxyqueuosine reductase
MGFHQTAIASLEPMDDALREYQAWLDQDFAAGMEYLKRDPPLRFSPARLLTAARSAIIVSVSYYTEPPWQRPGLFQGRVARYAVGKDYHTVIKERLLLLQAEIEKHLSRPLIARPYTDDVPLYEQALAVRHGLGFKGKHSLIIGPKLSGSYHFIAELFTDMELEADLPYEGTCGQCFRCGVACPTSAIKDGRVVDANLCISYLTIENKAGIPVSLRSELGDWVFGCDICQEVCPYNQRPAQTPWPEFLPESGVGHSIDLIELIKLESDRDFRTRFGQTPLKRPKRRGMVRNALVVIGNQLRALRNACKQTTGCTVDQPSTREMMIKVHSELRRIALRDPDEMLREHAFWALVGSPLLEDEDVEYIIASQSQEVVALQMIAHFRNM